MRPHPLHGLAEKLNRALHGPDQARHSSENSGLAGAVRPDDPQSLLPDFEIYSEYDRTSS